MGMFSDTGSKDRAVPYINVTPMIDILLVLLIIFMVVSPLKPSRFKALVPQEPDPNTQQDVKPNPLTLVVSIDKDLQLKLNENGGYGSVNDAGALGKFLSEEFERRRQNRSYRYGMETRNDLPESERIEKTVFVKAPRSLPYGEVVKVIDVIKGAGASPVGLQIDDLAE